jgi:hypothetical protein
LLWTVRLADVAEKLQFLHHSSDPAATGPLWML